MITGGMAIIAALIAAHPVRQQLLKMNLQSSIMAREVLAARLAAIEKRKTLTAEKINSITGALSSSIYFDEDVVSNSEWAFEASRKVSDVRDFMIEHQDSRSDSMSVDAARQLTIDTAARLAECLDAIHAPYSSNLTDPEYELSEEAISRIYRDSELAPEQVSGRISQMVKLGNDLDAAFSGDIEGLKNKIRRIDDLIFKDSFS
jgi:hypothetical protein